MTIKYVILFFLVGLIGSIVGDLLGEVILWGIHRIAQRFKQK